MTAARRAGSRRRLLSALSLRGRLLAGSLLVLVVAVTLADLSAYVALRHHLLQRSEETLRSASARVSAIHPRSPVRMTPNQVRSLVPSGTFVVLLDADGRIVGAASADENVPHPDRLDVAGSLASAPSEDPEVRDVGGRRVMLLGIDVDAEVSVGGPDGGDVAVHRAVVGIDLTPTAEATRALLHIEVVMGVIILLSWTAVAWAVIGLGLRPLRTMAQAAREIAEGRRERMPGHDRGSETGALATALDEAFDARAAADRRTREFLADASHELRTPIAAIRAWAEISRHDALSTAEALDRIEADAERMGALVDRMLELTRIAASRPADPSPVDLAALATDVVGGLQALAPGRILLRTSGAVPTVGDPLQLHALLRNIVVNAVRHAGADATIDVRVEALDTRAEVVVQDDGPGMTEAEIARAFDRFWRADAARSRPGTGLGLAIAREIAHQHGGTIEMTRADAGGLEVRVVLPGAPL